MKSKVRSALFCEWYSNNTSTSDPLSYISDAEKCVKDALGENLILADRVLSRTLGTQKELSQQDEYAASCLASAISEAGAREFTECEMREITETARGEVEQTYKDEEDSWLLRKKIWTNYRCPFLWDMLKISGLASEPLGTKLLKENSFRNVGRVLMLFGAPCSYLAKRLEDTEVYNEVVGSSHEKPIASILETFITSATRDGVARERVTALLDLLSIGSLKFFDDQITVYLSYRLEIVAEDQSADNEMIKSHVERYLRQVRLEAPNRKEPHYLNQLVAAEKLIRSVRRPDLIRQFQDFVKDERQATPEFFKALMTYKRLLCGNLGNGSIIPNLQKLAEMQKGVGSKSYRNRIILFYAATVLSCIVGLVIKLTSPNFSWLHLVIVFAVLLLALPILLFALLPVSDRSQYLRSVTGRYNSADIEALKVTNLRSSKDLDSVAQGLGFIIADIALVQDQEAREFLLSLINESAQFIAAQALVSTGDQSLTAPFFSGLRPFIESELQNPTSRKPDTPASLSPFALKVVCLISHDPALELNSTSHNQAEVPGAGR